VVYDEVIHRMPDGWEVVKFEKGLHERSDNLREILQKEINESQSFDIIVLGYGFCGKSAEGLVSENTFLVIPKCDDCISLFLGSTSEYKKQHSKEPGSFYLTRGYIGESDNPLLFNRSEYEEKYDTETLEWFMKEMLKNYTRMVYINTGNYPPEEWRDIAKEQAEKYDLRFEEINGTDQYFKKLLSGIWDGGFVIVEPGEKLKFDMFMDQPG
jgi:hypothetical protein